MGMTNGAYPLKLSQLRKWRFGCVVEYRTPFLRKVGKAICTPENYSRAWRAWFGTPSEEDRMLRKWKPAEQLCVMCSKCGSGCSWSDTLEPVDGWVAEQTYDATGNPYSWQITACPEFAPEGRRKGRDSDSLNDDGAVRLIQAALELAKRDYIRTGSTVTKDEVACFLADWTPDWMDSLRKLHADRNYFWGKQHFDVVFEQQPLLLYAGGEA